MLHVFSMNLILDLTLVASSVSYFTRRLSRRGRTVIFSVHQPRFTIFKLFDRLSLLVDGHCVFHGLASQALPFFESLGKLTDVIFTRVMY